MDKPSDTHRSRLRFRSPGGLVLLGAALLALLGLVAAVSRAHHTPGGHAGIHSPPSGVGNYVFTIFAIVTLSGAAALFYLWFSERDAIAQMHRRRGRRGTYKALLFLMILGLVAAIVTRTGGFHLWNRGSTATGSQRGGGVTVKPVNKKPRTPNVSRAPQLEWLPVMIASGAGLGVLAFVGLRSLRRARGQLLEQHILEQRFESLLDETLDDLYANADPRESIIAAYARMERLFATAGLPRKAHEAPLEYLSRALGELRASGAALGRLTGLFQRAKFSAHEVHELMRTEAIQALTEVRDELRAKREEDKLHREQAQQARSAQLERQGDATPGEDPFVAAAEKARGDIYGGGRY